MLKDKKTVLVFGVFDGLHDGHRSFLREARRHGERLIAVVAQDATVKYLKGRMPRKSLAERLADLTRENLADEIVAGDESINSWNIVATHLPDIICLGYDETALATALAKH